MSTPLTATATASVSLGLQPQSLLLRDVANQLESVARGSRDLLPAPLDKQPLLNLLERLGGHAGGTDIPRTSPLPPLLSEPPFPPPDPPPYPPPSMSPLLPGPSPHMGGPLPVKIKSSSLSYSNAAGRVGFDFGTHFNDFNNEGHMYPTHGVGDLDTTADLMARFVKSAQGDPFHITDLNIDIRVTDPAMTNENCFFDFHTISTKILDGSAKLPDGSRIESHIPYFTGRDHTEDKCAAKIDWISGNAAFVDPHQCGSLPGFHAIKDVTFPTTLASTRDTPYLADDEHLALTLFMDGKQSRLTNGGNVSNWRWVTPLGMGRPLSWFVAQAYVECAGAPDADRADCESATTTAGETVSIRPRTSGETDDLASIATGNRYMKTVSDSVPIRPAGRAAAFNQRYGNKCVDFGDVMLKAEPSRVGIAEGINLPLVREVERVGEAFKHDKQMQFHEMLRAIRESGALDAVSIYDTAPLPAAVDVLMTWFIHRYINTDTYNISTRALVTKAMLPPSYMWSPVCETGWLVVEAERELPVPSTEGEFFIGWVIDAQPLFETDAADSTVASAVSPAGKLQELASKGYALHQGPGLIFETCGDFAHHGTQEPFILKHNHPPAQQRDESDAKFALRVKSQSPKIHWRLDSPSVIHGSLAMGAVTSTSVAAGQMALASIGTKTPVGVRSRSPNFLGERYQELLANSSAVRDLCTRRPYAADEVYECLSQGGRSVFTYGVKQQQLQQGSYTPAATYRSPYG